MNISKESCNRNNRYRCPKQEIEFLESDTNMSDKIRQFDVEQFQSVETVDFNVFRRPLHPELFEICRSQRFYQGDYEVNIWVTGCSHVVSVTNDGQTLCENVCRHDQMLPARGLVRRMPFVGNRKYQCKWADQKNIYMMSFLAEQMGESVYAKTHNDLLRVARKRGIYVPFQNNVATNGLSPFTFIDYEAHWEELHIYAFHAFPEQRTILKSQSLFSMKK